MFYRESKISIKYFEAKITIHAIKTQGQNEFLVANYTHACVDCLQLSQSGLSLSSKQSYSDNRTAEQVRQELALSQISHTSYHAELNLYIVG